MGASRQRKRVSTEDDELALRRVRVYIGQLTHGVGTWRTQTTVSIGDVVSNGKLHITDVGHMRYVEVYQGNRPVGTLRYGRPSQTIYATDRGF